MKRGFTVEEHRQTGALLHRVREVLQGQAVILGEAYPAQHRALKQLEKALRDLDAVRSELDNTLFREHPAAADEQIYYPLKSAEGVSWKECEECRKLRYLVAAIGLVLRHVNRRSAGDHAAWMYIAALQNMTPELRKAIEEAETALEPEYLLHVPAESRNGESAFRFMVGAIYR